MSATDPRLGRLPQFDERSREFPIRSLIPDTARPVSKTWACRKHLDQGRTPSCVGHGWAHEIKAEPVVDDVTEDLALVIYRGAQSLDGDPNPHEGSSVLAGVKAASGLGYYNGYRWAFGINDVLLALSHVGPVVLGVNWYDGMMNPDLMAQIHPTGNVAGGHCILAKGLNVRTQMITLHQSWGLNWGRSGDCVISVTDLARLLHEDGEACVPTTRLHAHPNVTPQQPGTPTTDPSGPVAPH